MACKVKKCSCAHEFQDKEYGVGMRLCNPTGKSGGEAKSYKCTVCGKEHGADKEKTKEVKGK